MLKKIFLFLPVIVYHFCMSFVMAIEIVPTNDSYYKSNDSNIIMDGENSEYLDQGIIINSGTLHATNVVTNVHTATNVNNSDDIPSVFDQYRNTTFGEMRNSLVKIQNNNLKLSILYSIDDASHWSLMKFVIDAALLFNGNVKASDIKKIIRLFKIIHISDKYVLEHIEVNKELLSQSKDESIPLNCAIDLLSKEYSQVEEFIKSLEWIAYCAGADYLMTRVVMRSGEGGVLCSYSCSDIKSIAQLLRVVDMLCDYCVVGKEVNIYYYEHFIQYFEDYFIKTRSFNVTFINDILLLAIKSNNVLFYDSAKRKSFIDKLLIVLDFLVNHSFEWANNF